VQTIVLRPFAHLFGRLSRPATAVRVLQLVEDGSRARGLAVTRTPYGNERPFNALRLAPDLVKRPGVSVRVFMTGDGVACARRGQTTPDGYYNVERMVRSLARRGEVAA